MSSGRSIVTVYFTAIGGALLVGLIWLAPLPSWASMLVMLLLGVGAVPVVGAIKRRSRPLPPPETPVASALAVDPREEQLSDVLLPSNRDDYYFVFSATVLWYPMGAATNESAANLGALAVDTVVKRAREITEHRDPAYASLVRHELGAALGTMQADPSGCLKVMARSVRLVLPDGDQQRLGKLAAIRKKRAVWEHERTYEMSKREYLGNDVLKDPGSAVIWWLAKNDDDAAKTVQDIGVLARLSAAANNDDVSATFQRLAADLGAGNAPNAFSHDGSDVAQSLDGEKSAADHLDAFLGAMDLADGDPERDLFARRVADLAATHGHSAVADEVMRRFDIPGDPGESSEEEDDRS